MHCIIFCLQMHFCDDVKDVDKSELRASNFIFYSTNCDLTKVNSVITHLDNPKSKLDDKSQEESGSSLNLGYPENLHKIRKQNGTVLCIIDTPSEVKTDNLRSTIREKSLELRDKGICLNAIVNQVCIWKLFFDCQAFCPIAR